MLAKLIKYDFKSTSRYMIMIYLSIIFIAVITKTLISLNIYGDKLYFIPDVVVLTFEIILILTIITTYILQSVHFFTSMATDEAYLTFTLPVKTNRLIISKLFTAVSWNLSSVLLAIASAGLVFYSKDKAQSFFESIKSEFNNFSESYGVNTLAICLLGIIMMFLVFAIYNLFIYTSIGLGQLYTKNKLVGSFLAGIMMYIIIQIVAVIVLFPTVFVLDSQLSDNTQLYITMFISLSILFEIILSIAMYLLTNYIFSKKLNLE